jgi:hypothetical protein
MKTAASDGSIKAGQPDAPGIKPESSGGFFGRPWPVKPGKVLKTEIFLFQRPGPAGVFPVPGAGSGNLGAVSGPKPGFLGPKSPKTAAGAGPEF